MFSYTFSLLILTILLSSGSIFLLKRYFPSVYKVLIRIMRLIRRFFKGVIDRFGWFRGVLLIYLSFSAIFTLIVLTGFGENPLERIGILTILWLPAVAGRKVERYLKERRERQCQLPGRRR